MADWSPTRCLKGIVEESSIFLLSISCLLFTVTQSYVTHDVKLDIKKSNISGIFESWNCTSSFIHLDSHTSLEKSFKKNESKKVAWQKKGINLHLKLDPSCDNRDTISPRGISNPHMQFFEMANCTWWQLWFISRVFWVLWVIYVSRKILRKIRKVWDGQFDTYQGLLQMKLDG